MNLDPKSDNDWNEEVAILMRIMQALLAKENARKIALKLRIGQCRSRLEALLTYNVDADYWRKCVVLLEQARLFARQASETDSYSSLDSSSSESEDEESSSS